MKWLVNLFFPAECDHLTFAAQFPGNVGVANLVIADEHGDKI